MRNDDVRFVYNDAGKLEKITMTHRGQQLHMDLLYDAYRRVKEVHVVSYFYDTAGNLQEVINAEGRMRYDFDANKVVTQVIQDDKPLFTAKFDDFGRWQR